MLFSSGVKRHVAADVSGEIAISIFLKLASCQTLVTTDCTAWSQPGELSVYFHTEGQVNPTTFYMSFSISFAW
jgi:hypothetical protein